MEIKTAKLIESGVLINGSISLPDDSNNWIRDLYNEWLSSGNTPDPIETQALTEQDYTNATQAELDKQAQSMGYDNIYTAISYIGDPYQRFNDEALALRDWRSSVWVYANTVLSDVNNGSPQPDIDSYINAIPAFSL